MSMNRSFLILLLACTLLPAQEMVRVVKRPVERAVKLPGELKPFQAADLVARVDGYIESISVDAGSAVSRGQTIARLSAPEMAAQIAEAEARVGVLESQRTEAEARLAATQSNDTRLREAAKTPGVISGNELEQSARAVEAARAVIAAMQKSMDAAKASVRSRQELAALLLVRAPFSGVVTERRLHPGALAGPTSGAILRVEELQRLRLIVAVPEAMVGRVKRGLRMPFISPAFPGQSFSGTVARITGAMDEKTRTMPVELEVSNPKRLLAPGMYCEVQWSAAGLTNTTLVPPTSIVSTTERTFVIRNEGGVARWVNVKKMGPAGDLVEVLGPLTEGDMVVRRASDELRDGARLAAQK
jgi:membrane fusion protein, multidrug efflux system